MAVADAPQLRVPVSRLAALLDAFDMDLLGVEMGEGEVVTITARQRGNLPTVEVVEHMIDIDVRNQRAKAILEQGSDAQVRELVRGADDAPDAAH